MSALDAVGALGRSTLGVARGAGASTLVALRLLAAAPFAHPRETLRAAVVFGWKALPLALAVATFVGAILVVQTGFYVKKLGAREILGWAAGFAILREFGPLLMALVLSGRVGARNAAEIAALAVGEQLDALEVMAVDAYRALLAPRFLGEVIAVFSLISLGNLLSVASACGFAAIALDVPPGVFLRSLDLGLGAIDLAAGLSKGFVFGIAVGILSTRSGLSARGGGAEAVGRAATRSVVSTAYATLVLDYLLTRWIS